jgi:hypothetical protein
MGAAMSMTWITEGSRMRFEWCDAGHFEPRARFSALSVAAALNSSATF